MKEVKSKFLVKSLSKNMAQEMVLDSEVSWFSAILDELQEDVEVGDVGASSDSPGIWFKGNLIRRSNGKFGEVLFLEGELSARFFTNCVKSGRLMMDEFDAPVKAVFVDVEMIERYSLADETEIELEGEEYELYSYKDDVANLGEVLHEHVFLNKNPWPTLEGTSDSEEV